MNKIKLSIKQKDYNSAHNKFFKSITSDKNDLENIFKSYNYSLITWKIDDQKKLRLKSLKQITLLYLVPLRFIIML